MGLFKLAKLDSCIAQSNIRKIVFLGRPDIRLSFNIVPLCRFDQERIFKVRQILVYLSISSLLGTSLACGGKFTPFSEQRKIFLPWHYHKNFDDLDEDYEPGEFFSD